MFQLVGGLSHLPREVGYVFAREVTKLDLPPLARHLAAAPPFPKEPDDRLQALEKMHEGSACQNHWILNSGSLPGARYRMTLTPRFDQARAHTGTPRSSIPGHRSTAVDTMCLRWRRLQMTAAQR